MDLTRTERDITIFPSSCLVGLVSSVTPQYGEQLYISIGRLHEINRVISTNFNLLLNIQPRILIHILLFPFPYTYTMLERASIRKLINRHQDLVYLSKA
jgi:hypothetical protein